MKKVLKKGKRGNRKERLSAYGEILNQDQRASRIELIQMLIPLGLAAVEEELQFERMRIAGDRYSRVNPQYKRWGRMEIPFTWEIRRFVSRFPVSGMY